MFSVYVILAVFCILLGMFLAVHAFGTGGKRANIFEDIYYSVEDIDGTGILYTKSGE